MITTAHLYSCAIKLCGGEIGPHVFVAAFTADQTSIEGVDKDCAGQILAKRPSYVIDELRRVLYQVQCRRQKEEGRFSNSIVPSERLNARRESPLSLKGNIENRCLLDLMAAILAPYADMEGNVNRQETLVALGRSPDDSKPRGGEHALHQIIPLCGVEFYVGEWHGYKLRRQALDDVFMKIVNGHFSIRFPRLSLLLEMTSQ
jgi:hypothetical protein